MNTILKTKTTRKLRETTEDPPKLAANLVNCNSGCQRVLRWLHQSKVQMGNTNLARMLDNGERLEDLRTNVKHREPAEGDEPVNPMQLAAAVMGCTEGYCNKMAQLYRAFSTPARREELLAHRFPSSGAPLTWMHMEQLLKLYSDENSIVAFNDLLRQTLENEWSPDDVEAKIHQMKRLSGQPETRGGGRPTKVPRSLEQRANRLIKQTDVIVKNAGEIYNHEEHGFLPALKNLSQADVASKADELLDLTNKLKDNLTKVHELCTLKLGSDLPAMETYIRDCVRAAAESGGKKEAAMLEMVDASV